MDKVFEKSTNESNFEYLNPGSNSSITDLCAVCSKVHPNEENAEDIEDSWIQCDHCKHWFHTFCVDISDKDVNEYDSYHCDVCTKTVGQSTFKKFFNTHRYDRTKIDDNFELPVQIGTIKFIEELKKRNFRPLDQAGKFKELRGEELTFNHLKIDGFDYPILIRHSNGLKMKIPENFDHQFLLENLGDNYEVEVINVLKQDVFKTTLSKLINELNIEEKKRTRIINCISLELSRSKISDQIEPPQVIKDISWADQIFLDGESKPAVAKYCLLSQKNSYTDYHIDFSGTSVWYHVVKGKKRFYFIEPTEKNLKAYEEWSVKNKEDDIFFPDEIGVENCFEFTLEPGNTMLIPTGWIHAVLTPEDSIVFGGNFLQSFRADLQIRIFNMEEKMQFKDKFKYPDFRLTHWLAIKCVYEFLKELIKNNYLTQKSCSTNLKHYNLFKSFETFRNFTLDYYNEIMSLEKRDSEEEFEWKVIKENNSLMSLRTKMKKCLEKIQPQEEPKNVNLIEKSESIAKGTLNKTELPQKSVKLKNHNDDSDRTHKRKKLDTNQSNNSPKSSPIINEQTHFNLRPIIINLNAHNPDKAPLELPPISSKYSSFKNDKSNHQNGANQFSKEKSKLPQLTPISKELGKNLQRNLLSTYKIPKKKGSQESSNKTGDLLTHKLITDKELKSEIKQKLSQEDDWVENDDLKEKNEKLDLKLTNFNFGEDWSND